MKIQQHIQQTYALNVNCCFHILNCTWRKKQLKVCGRKCKEYHYCLLIKDRYNMQDKIHIGFLCIRVCMYIYILLIKLNYHYITLHYKFSGLWVPCNINESLRDLAFFHIYRVAIHLFFGSYLFHVSAYNGFIYVTNIQYSLDYANISTKKHIYEHKYIS